MILANQEISLAEVSYDYLHITWDGGVGLYIMYIEKGNSAGAHSSAQLRGS